MVRVLLRGHPGPHVRALLRQLPDAGLGAQEENSITTANRAESEDVTRV